MEETEDTGTRAGAQGKSAGGGGSLAGITKKVQCDVRGQQGRLIMLEHRQHLVEIIEEPPLSG